jgi:hypothetical protein
MRIILIIWFCQRIVSFFLQSSNDCNAATAAAGLYLAGMCQLQTFILLLAFALRAAVAPVSPLSCGRPFRLRRVTFYRDKK